MKNKNNLFVSGISGLLVMILIVLVRFVDVRPIGPEGTSIGLSRLNGFFFRLSGVNILWYHITDWLGVAAILVAFLFAMAGFVQLIKRRSILKVDHDCQLQTDHHAGRNTSGSIFPLLAYNARLCNNGERNNAYRKICEGETDLSRAERNLRGNHRNDSDRKVDCRGSLVYRYCRRRTDQHFPVKFIFGSVETNEEEYH